MNIHINEYFLYFAWGCSTLSKGLTTDDINPCPNKAMQLDPCVKASRDPRHRSNRPNSQRCRPATDAGWKQRPRWCSTTQTRTTRSRLRRAGAATTTTTTTRRMRTPGNTRRPMALNPANFVNEIKHQTKSLFFKGSQKWLPLTNPIAPQQWVHESTNPWDQIMFCEIEWIICFQQSFLVPSTSRPAWFFPPLWIKIHQSPSLE